MAYYWQNCQWQNCQWRIYQKTIGKIANNTIGEIANQKRKNKERTKENRKEVFDYYLSLGLIQHKKYTPAMDNAIKTAMENYGYTIQYCKILLDRHKRVVEKTKNSEYPVRPRPLHEFFGQKVYGGKHLICADYEEGGRYYKKLEDDGVYTRVIDLPGLGKRKPDNLLERVKEREKEEAERMAREASHGA